MLHNRTPFFFSADIMENHVWVAVPENHRLSLPNQQTMMLIVAPPQLRMTPKRDKLAMESLKRKIAS
jgi:hypothetical protein